MKLVYQGCDRSGKSVSATIEAADSAEAVERLRREGLYVTTIAPVSEGDAARVQRKKTRRGRSGGGDKKHLMMFTRQFYLLTSTGTPIVQALESLEQQVDHAGWKNVVTSVRKQVEDGNQLSEAMRQHPGYFDPVYCSLIGAGESSGKLSVMLERLATLTRKQMQIRNAVLGALVYPGVLISISLVVTVLMLTVVLPQFQKMFESMDVPLPPSTQVMMAASALIRSYWPALIVIAAVGVVGLRWWLKSSSGQRTVDTVLLRLPQIGRLTRSLITARIARLLGILLNSHLPLVDVLDLVGHSIRNHHYAKLVIKAQEAVTRGEPVSSAFSDSRLIQPTVREAIRSGEQSGQMAVALVAIADYMDEENDVIVQSLSSIIEPLILVVLGGLVGFMAVSMFMPLFDMTSMAG